MGWWSTPWNELRTPDLDQWFQAERGTNPSRVRGCLSVPRMSKLVIYCSSSICKSILFPTELTAMASISSQTSGLILIVGGVILSLAGGAQIFIGIFMDSAAYLGLFFASGILVGIYLFSCSFSCWFRFYRCWDRIYWDWKDKFKLIIIIRKY